jgi:SAM-dependent methyltransferase
MKVKASRLRRSNRSHRAAASRRQRNSPEETVRHGWNRLSVVYRPDGSQVDGTGHRTREYLRWLAPVLRAVTPGSKVLDLGCGNGDPAARILSESYSVTGVDISEVQIRRARKLIPGARFLRGDMTSVSFQPSSFQAVVALYSIIHVPLRKQRPLIRRIFRWLIPRGWFLTIVGKEAWTGRETSWLGVRTPMYWSHTDAGTYERWFRKAGFKILRRKFIPEGNSGHELFLTRKEVVRTSGKRQPL